MAKPLSETEIMRRWNLKPDPAGPLAQPLAGSSQARLIAVVTADGRRAVLKAAPSRDEAASEIAALRAYGGFAVQLLNADEPSGVLLLERAEPGRRLKDEWQVGRERETTAIAAQLIGELTTAGGPTAGLPHIATLATTFTRVPAPAEIRSDIENASLEFNVLISSAPTQAVVLHGDLHHENIVSAERRPWLAIDPKGLVGDPDFEFGAFLRNPFPEIAESTNLEAILIERLAIFAQRLDRSPERIRRWAAVQARLAALWTIEDGSGDWRPWIRIAHALDRSRSGLVESTR